jgi:hypothetical protein
VAFSLLHFPALIGNQYHFLEKSIQSTPISSYFEFREYQITMSSMQSSRMPEFDLESRPFAQSNPFTNDGNVFYHDARRPLDDFLYSGQANITKAPFPFTPQRPFAGPELFAPITADYDPQHADVALSGAWINASAIHVQAESFGPTPAHVRTAPRHGDPAPAVQGHLRRKSNVEILAAHSKHPCSLRLRLNSNHTAESTIAEDGTITCACGGIYRNASAGKNWRRHVKDVQFPNQFRCSECGHTCARQNGLLQHNVRSHPEKVYTCPTCGRKFMTQQLLYNHMEKHR